MSGFVKAGERGQVLGSLVAADSPNGNVRGAGLRIGIDARLLGDSATGIGRYVSELGKQLDLLLPRAEFFLYAPWPISPPVDSPRWYIRIDPWGKIFERFRNLWVSKHAWMLLRTRALCLRDHINVFWATEAPFIPHLPETVRVVALVHDFRYRVAPETQRRATLYMRRILERRHERVDFLITNSQGTADRLYQMLKRQPAGIARPAAGSEFYRREEAEVKSVLHRYGIQRPYLFSLANAAATPHKNVRLLIRVFGDLRRGGYLHNYSLVLGGPSSDRLLSEFRRDYSEQCTDVVALGYIDADDLPAMYSGADALVFPSIYEGFGMPVLEARACQTKIVTTDLPELREAGGDRAIYIRPDAKGIRQGILAALAAQPPAGADTLWTWRDSARVLADAIDPVEVN
jgi:glycosyltransferase involved in cell wall biosynthesis